MSTTIRDLEELLNIANALQGQAEIKEARGSVRTAYIASVVKRLASNAADEIERAIVIEREEINEH